MEWTAGCLCGSIRYRASDAPRWASYCHCGNCGSSLTFEADGLMFLSLGSLDFPEHVVVERHCDTRFRPPGIELADGLPQFPGPAGGQGGRHGGRRGH